MSTNKVPITRIGKFFGSEDYSLDLSIGEEWLFQIMAPENKNLGNSKINQTEPGNIKISVYQKQLDELGVDINYGDYIGYYETEDRVRYYTVNNDGRVTSDNKHTYAGYKPFYRTVMASAVIDNEFRGL